MENVLTRSAFVIGATAHRSKEFCRQDNLVTMAFEPAPDVLLGSANCLWRSSQRISVSSIEEGNTCIKCLAHNGVGGWFIALIPKGHCAQAYLGYFQPGATQTLYFHAPFSPVVRLWPPERMPCINGAICKGSTEMHR